MVDCNWKVKCRHCGKCSVACCLQVVALYDYKAQRSDELSLRSGDSVLVLYKDSANWWMGQLPSGQQGFFPSNYVTEGKCIAARTEVVAAQDVSYSQSVSFCGTSRLPRYLRYRYHLFYHNVVTFYSVTMFFT